MVEQRFEKEYSFSLRVMGSLLNSIHSPVEGFIDVIAKGMIKKVRPARPQPFWRAERTSST